MIKLSEDEKKQLQNLQAYPEWGTFKKVLDEFAGQTESINAISPTDKISIESQYFGITFARKLVAALLRDMLIIWKRKDTPKKDPFE